MLVVQTEPGIHQWDLQLKAISRPLYVRSPFKNDLFGGVQS